MLTQTCTETTVCAQNRSSLKRRKILAGALRDIDVLERYGTALTEPHVKHIRGKLWELRIKSASEISRIFYFIPIGKSIVLLHGFVKKTPIVEYRRITRSDSVFRMESDHFSTEYARSCRNLYTRSTSPLRKGGAR
ncbi:MAG: type II toxin-antitoxin system RelE/ParE family toxin [Oscillospiraceae bacterium]|nr:type II toxin-antitoxin system RelE/ParE family toxin [Oscillospiraceae bacterium]